MCQVNSQKFELLPGQAIMLSPCVICAAHKTLKIRQHWGGMHVRTVGIILAVAVAISALLFFRRFPAFASDIVATSGRRLASTNMTMQALPVRKS